MNKPNPFDESTIISFYVEEPSIYREASITITDLSGKVVWKKVVVLDAGMNE